MDPDGAEWIFIESNLEFDRRFDDSEARMPCRNIALSSDVDVLQLINAEESIREIKLTLPRSSGQVPVGIKDKIKLDKLERERAEYLRRVILKTHHHNAKCICGSGRKYRKCCRAKMLQVGIT